ncbi:MAG: anhydro-N-acetylmuramic acid kinase [Pseudomonadota bacterium]
MTKQTDHFLHALGSISGTSMDGIDICAIETDGKTIRRGFAGMTIAYSDALRADLVAIMEKPDSIMTDPLHDLERRVTTEFANAINSYKKDCAIDLIGCHGQTILHRPEIAYTRQLINGALLAKLCDCDCVTQFRVSDMENGGQGAPLAPLYHQAIVPPSAYPALVLNLGGVANATFLTEDSILAGDAGPANAILDDFVLRHTKTPFDHDGALARRGTVDHTILARFMEDPYFSMPFPKSCDRHQFHALLDMLAHLDIYDACATIIECSVAAIQESMKYAPSPIKTCYFCGGGAQNSYFAERLQQTLAIACQNIDHLGFSPDALEAQAFGFLGVRALKGWPLSVPTTTGVNAPCCGGVIYKRPI